MKDATRLIRSLILMPFIAGLPVSEAAAAQPCQPGPMTSVVANTINALRYSWPRGEILLLGALHDGDGKRRVSQGGFQELQQMARGGYIVLRETQARLDAPGGFGWGQWMGAAVHGVIAKYDVQPGSVRSDRSYRETQDSFDIAAGVASSTKVVRTEPMQGGGDRYCVVHVTFRYRPTEATRPILAARDGGHFSENRKGRVLLKDDPFSDKWVMVTGDFVNAESADFHSNSVPLALASIVGPATIAPPSLPSTPPTPSPPPPGPIPNQTAHAGVNPHIAKEFFAQGGDKLGKYELGGTVIVSTYALQRWTSTHMGGEAVLEYGGSAVGWKLKSMGGGVTDVSAMVSMGIPRPIADQLVAGKAR